MKQKGFTLTELLVGLAIAGITFLAASFIMSNQLRVYKNTRMISEAQESARNGIDLIANDLKMAGYGIGKEHAVRYYAENQDIYDFKDIKSDGDKEGNDSLVLVRAFGEPYTIVKYDYDYEDTSAPPGILCLCGNVVDKFWKNPNSSTDEYLDASLFNETRSDYMSVSILSVESSLNCDGGKLAMNCSSVSDAWTRVVFTPKPISASPSPSQEEMGMRKSEDSEKTDYIGGYLYPNLKVIAYTVSEEDRADLSWKNNEKRAILWRDDGSGPQAVAEDVEGFQVDFESDLKNKGTSTYGGRRIYPTCTSGKKIRNDKYELPGFDENVCGIRSHLAIVTLVTRVKDEDKKGIDAAIIKLPVELRRPSNGNKFDDRCYPNSDCKEPDKYKRRAIVKHVIMGNKQ